MRFYKNQHQFYIGIDLHARTMLVCSFYIDKVVHNMNMPQRPISDSEQTVRISISISKAAYLELENISYEKKVSLAWVVRESIEKYLKEKQNEQKQ